jgi:hypothetical protein
VLLEQSERSVADITVMANTKMGAAVLRRQGLF